METEYLWRGHSGEDRVPVVRNYRRARGSYDAVVRSFVAFGRLQGWPTPFFPSDSSFRKFSEIGERSMKIIEEDTE